MAAMDEPVTALSPMIPQRLQLGSHPFIFPSVPQVQMAVEAKFVQDTLKGDGVTEIRMRFIRRIEDNLPAGEE